MNQSAQPPDSGSEQEGAIYRRIVLNLLDGLPPETKEAARAWAVPRWLDDALMQRLAGEGVDVAAVRSALLGMRFLTQEAQGRLRVPGEVRAIVLETWAESPSRFEALNRTSQSYFAARAQEAPAFERPIYEREAIYHQLIVDEATGLRRLLDHFEDAHGRHQFSMAEEDVRLLEEVQQQLDGERQTWLRYFTARLDLMYNRGKRGRPAFASFASAHDGEAPALLPALAHWHLGQIELVRSRWKDAIDAFQQSLEALRALDEKQYAARVMLSLGNAYLDLTYDAGGPLAQEHRAATGKLDRLLHVLQHLPFLLVRRLLRRLPVLPGLRYFGTSYQEWIIAHLLVQASRWYRRAERQFRQVGDGAGASDALRALAAVEVELDRPTLARRRYRALSGKPAIQDSPFRLAGIWHGLGRLALAEGQPREALADLERASTTYRRLQATRQYAEAQTGMGLAQTAQGDRPAAASAFLRSFDAFAELEDGVALTQVAWQLEGLAAQNGLPADQEAAVAEALDGVPWRHYLSRFPDLILRRFRRLALLRALPLSYLLSLILGAAMLIALIIVESVFTASLRQADLTVLTVTDVLVLVLGVLLPLPGVLWLYRLVYTLFGAVEVRNLGRRLRPIQQEQPEITTTGPEGLTSRNGRELILNWDEIQEVVSVDFRLWRRTIDLNSRTFLVTNEGTYPIEAITAGYERLKADIRSRLGEGARFRSLDFSILGSVAAPVTALIALVFALVIVFVVGNVELTSEPRGGPVFTLWFSSLLIVFMPTLWFLFPIATIWRLIGHRKAVAAFLEESSLAVPDWLLWLALVLATLLAAGWLVLLASTG